MRQVLGLYEIGRERVTLVVTGDMDASFTFLPDRSKTSEMVIGIGDDTWWRVLRNLYHEVFEFAMTRQNCRFDPNQDMGHSMSTYLFMMDHQVFASVCGLAADFIARCENDLRLVWIQYHKKKKS